MVISTIRLLITEHLLNSLMRLGPMIATFQCNIRSQHWRVQVVACTWLPCFDVLIKTCWMLQLSTPDVQWQHVATGEVKCAQYVPSNVVICCVEMLYSDLEISAMSIKILV